MTDILLFSFMVLFSIIGWLLAGKDRAQSKEIENMRVTYRAEIDQLYRLHHANEKSLADYKLLIAECHYTQPQIDNKFQQLDNTMKGGFCELSADIKALTKTLINHMMDKSAS